MIPFLLLFSQFSSLHYARASIILDRQCWVEYPLSRYEASSTVDRRNEYVTLIGPPLEYDTVSTHNTEDYSPWSYAPVCTDVLPNVKDKLCVYTSTSFGNGRGISLFTTPSLAERILSSPAFTDPFEFDDQQVNVDSGAWNAVPIPNKGIGMLASKDLKFKDPVTAYTPAIIAYLEMDLPTAVREGWWRKAIDQLPEKLRNDYLSLTYIYGDERVRVQDIVKANTFQVHIEGVNHLAVFPETSRLNHACNPNAQYIIDTDLLTHFVHVTRPIAKGEEITISYTSPLDFTAHRREHLQESFHFTCSCPRCTSPETDSTFQTMSTLQSQLNDWSPNSLGSPEVAEQLLQLYRNEGLEGFMDMPYGFASLAWNAVGDVEKAVIYAEKATEAILMKDGRWSQNLGIWRELLEGPERHWSYKRRI